MSEAAQPGKAKTERRLEKSLELDTSPEQIWNALTDPKQLVQWFPLEARVTPGVGGKFFLSWGPDYEGEGEIIAWEPGKRFGWKEPLGTIEFIIEARGGKTILRLVQSAFLSGEAWEDEWFESTSYGWGFMLISLHWMLERHPGADRQVRWPRQKTSLSREEAYTRVFSAGAIFEADARSLAAGTAYALKTTTGESWSGTVEFAKPLRGICLSIRELNDALLWFTIEGTPGKIDAQIWLSAWGVGESRLDAVRDKLAIRLREALA